MKIQHCEICNWFYDKLRPRCPICGATKIAIGRNRWYVDFTLTEPRQIVNGAKGWTDKLREIVAAAK